MKLQTRELIGSALDWAVAKALGYEPYMRYGYVMVQPSKKKLFGLIPKDPVRVRFSTDWAQGGPVIDQASISIEQFGSDGRSAYAHMLNHSLYGVYGPTPLIAAMRCFVFSKSGPEVEVPDAVPVNN